MTQPPLSKWHCRVPIRDGPPGLLLPRPPSPSSSEAAGLASFPFPRAGCCLHSCTSHLVDRLAHEERRGWLREGKSACCLCTCACAQLPFPAFCFISWVAHAQSGCLGSSPEKPKSQALGGGVGQTTQNPRLELGTQTRRLASIPWCNEWSNISKGWGRGDRWSPEAQGFL